MFVVHIVLVPIYPSRETSPPVMCVRLQSILCYGPWGVQPDAHVLCTCFSLDQVLHGDELQADHWKIYPCAPWKTHNPKGANTRGRGNLMQLHQIDHRPQTRREKPLEIVFFWDVCKPNYSSSRVPANHGHLVDALISLIHLAVFEGLVRSQQGISMIWMNLRVGNGVVRFKMPQGVLSQTSADVCTACLRNGRSTSFAASPILNS